MFLSNLKRRGWHPRERHHSGTYPKGAEAIHLEITQNVGRKCLMLSPVTAPAYIYIYTPNVNKSLENSGQ